MSYLEKFAKISLNDCWEAIKKEEDVEEVSDVAEDLPEGLDRDRLPGHVALILDGSRRWARQRGLTHQQGYEAGTRALKDFLIDCAGWNIPIISLFVMSCENLFRPKEEVECLYMLFEKALAPDGIRILMRIGAKIKAIGDTSALPISLQETIKNAEEATKNNTRHQVLLAVNYSGQNDIVQACQNLATKVEEGILKPEEINKSLIEQELQTHVASIPSPDLLIRTSGEFRISNFYLWQSAYTELYFTDTLWPDFTKDDYAKALLSYQKRGRRFGKI